MRPVHLVLTILAGIALVGCQTTSAPPDAAEAVAGVDRIEMHDDAFDPPVVEVPPGSTITWAFTDGRRTHNVVGDDFQSEVAAEGTFSHTFDDPGTYEYRCTLHRGMDGRIIVTDA